MSTNLPHKLNIITLTTCLVLATAFVIASPAKAQEDNSGRISITAIPPRLGEDSTLKINPGEKTQIEVRARNSSDSPVTIKSSAIDFIVGEDGVTPVPLEGKDADNNRWSLASWLTIVPTQQTLQPNESGVISVVIDVPKDALPGGHYAMVVHQPSTGGLDEQSGSGAGINQRVGTLLYAIVDGPIQESAFVRNFTFPKWSEFGPVPYSYTVENGSDVHIRPQTNIEIYNLFGHKVDSLQQGPKNVFPYESRSFEGQWDRIWGFGPYTAKLVMSYGSQGAVVIARTSFWLLPVKLMIALITMIGIFIIAGMSIRRHLLHRKNDQSKRIQELESQVRQMQNQETDQPKS